MSMIGFASAQNAGENVGNAVKDFVQGVSSALEPVLRYTLGGEDLSADTFLVKVLLFVLMLSILYYAVSKVPMLNENDYVHWIIAIVIAILGARFLSSEALVNFIWLPNGILGVTLAAFLPFLIYFFIIESFTKHKIVRRIGWALFIVLYVGLTIIRWPDFAGEKIGNVPFNLAWLYLITAGLALLSFLFDRFIQEKEEEHKTKGRRRRDFIINETKISARIADLIDLLVQAPAGSPQAAAIEAQLKDEEKKLKMFRKIMNS